MPIPDKNLSAKLKAANQILKDKDYSPEAERQLVELLHSATPEEQKKIGWIIEGWQLAKAESELLEISGP
jgi:hypothetical protein